jgi:hypothetical protein
MSTYIIFAAFVDNPSDPRAEEKQHDIIEHAHVPHWHNNSADDVAILMADIAMPMFGQKVLSSRHG